MKFESNLPEPSIGIGWNDCGVPKMVLCAIFEGLNSEGIDYCVMRNFDLLPDSVGDSDLDILLRPRQHLIAERTIRKVLQEFGGAVVARVPARGSYLKTMGSTDGRWWGLAIDLVADVDYRGMVYITAGEVLSRSVLHHGVRVASAADAALGALGKELINNLSAETRYLERARKAWFDYKEDCIEALAAYSGKVREMTIELLEREMPLDADLRKLGLAMRFDLIKRHGFSKRLMAISHELFRRMERVFRRPGALIVLSGDDPLILRAALASILPVLKRAFHKRVLLSNGELGNFSEELSEVRTYDYSDLKVLGVFFRFGVNYFRRAYPRMMGKPHLICSIGCLDEFSNKDLSFFGRFVKSLLPQPDIILGINEGVNSSAMGASNRWRNKKGVKLVQCSNCMPGQQANAVLSCLLKSLADRVRC